MSQCRSYCIAVSASLGVKIISILLGNFPIFRNKTIMTRSARRGEKKQALSATPWLELKNGVDNEQVQGTAVKILN